MGQESSDMPAPEVAAGALTERFRLLLLSAAFAAWATWPIVAVAKHFVGAAKES